ncbi:MAG: hypothetical protein K0R57_3958 [Paenibacillaceae bacterium]|jgi:hypothetical protein|nr:hypothetical protein [Paenibacillaceae bacterium]
MVNAAHKKEHIRVRNRIVQLARSKVGKLVYSFGKKNIATGRGDCSGFCNFIFLKSVGINIGSRTSIQIKKGWKVHENKEMPGDIVFFRNIYRKGVSHVGIVSRPGSFIGLQTTGCKERSYMRGYWKNKFMHIRRINLVNKKGSKHMTNNEQVFISAQRIVNVYVVVCTGNSMSDGKIKMDIRGANRIWKSSGISFRLKGITRHTEEAYRFKEREFVGGILLNKQPKKVQKLIRYNPVSSSRNDIAVIYLDTSSIRDVKAKRITTGAIYFFNRKQGPRTATILMASNSSQRAQMLAHEFGHALFVDPVSGLAVNPSPTMAPKDPTHDLERKNLMFPKPPAKPVTNQNQRNKALKSTLIR